MKPDSHWVERVGQLLARADRQRQAAFTSLDSLKVSVDRALRVAQQAEAERAEGPGGSWRRALLAKITLQIKHFHMADEAKAFLIAVNCEAVDQLSDTQLDALGRWLQQWMQPDCDVGELIEVLA